jgi:hypothetical protein
LTSSAVANSPAYHVSLLESAAQPRHGERTNTVATISSDGVIVGNAGAVYDGSLRPVRWSPGESLGQELGVLGTATNGSTEGQALGVNSAGIAVGVVHKYANGYDNGPTAVRWERGAAEAKERTGAGGRVVVDHRCPVPRAAGGDRYSVVIVT